MASVKHNEQVLPFKIFPIDVMLYLTNNSTVAVIHRTTASIRVITDFITWNSNSR